MGDRTLKHADVWTDRTFACEDLGQHYDGDTIKLRADTGFGGSQTFSCRLDEVDTPEVKGGTVLTKALAKFARDEVTRRLREADEIVIEVTVWKGRYGRPIVRVFLDGESLAPWLIEQRLGLPYDGGSRKTFLPLHIENAEHLRDAGRLEGYLSK